MSAEIRSYLQNIDAEQMLECFHDGAYYFDFNLKKQIPLEERRKKSFSSGEGKNKATFKLTVYPSRLKGEFIRKGGPKNGENFEFNENFFDCINDATNWINNLVVD